MAALIDRDSVTWWSRVIFILFTVLTISTTSLPDPYRVAALFEPEYESMELAFKYAMQKMNLRNIIGPSRLLIFHVEQVTPHDSFEANREVCRQIKEGIAAVFGPINKVPRAHVQSICNAFEIPHLQAQWDSRENRDYFSISVYPDAQTLSRAYAELLKEWHWKQFTVIYEDNDGLIRLQEVLKLAQGAEHKVTVRKLHQYVSGYITMFKDLKEKNEYHLIIDCHSTKVKNVLHEALKVNMLSEYYHFHFTTLDLGLVDLEDYKYGGANITAMRLIDPARPQVLDVMSEWSITENNNGKSPLLGQPIVPTETALMYDAVQLFALGLKELAQAQDVKTEPLSCNKKQTWLYGNSLLNYMKSMDFEGLSGRIRFENGRRREFSLDITELTQKGLKKVGTWDSKDGVEITTSFKEKQKEDLTKLANKTLRVVTIYEEPYLMLRSEPDERGRMHEGFMIDLLDLISEKLGFTYTVYQVEDEKYGAEIEPGKWNGMVGDLMKRDGEQKADLAAAGMTITYKREEVVDFTKPFLNLGITIIYKKPVKTPPELFSFLNPLSIDVWIYMLAAYLCVSFMLFVIARFSPYEWTNPHPCNEDSDMVENQFTILNSLWFTIGSLMQQGCEIAPQAISTRMVACLWWFFTLIMISSYTANLAAFLTVERMESPIESADDLAKQTAIKYGTLNSGSTKDFFRKLEYLRKLIYKIQHRESDPVLVYIVKKRLFTDNYLGSDVAPRTTSTRIVASIWYLFTLILVSSYTANLAAFLTVERMASPIENVEDLSQQTSILYGTLASGSTYEFFQIENPKMGTLADSEEPIRTASANSVESDLECTLRIYFDNVTLMLHNVPLTPKKPNYNLRRRNIYNGPSRRHCMLHNGKFHWFEMGSDIAPRALSTRMLASVWYYFTIIFVASYTANLAAFLSIEQLFSVINGVEDLAKQSNIMYGTLAAGSTYEFFQKSDIPTYKRMWAFMQANADVAFVNSSAEGFERVKNTDYAYLAESTTIDYTVQRNCELDQVGGLLDSKGYGIATPKDSPWKEYLSNEIIFFQENQKISKLYTKWWKEKSGGACNEDESKKSKNANALGVTNVGGVFVVLIGGMFAGFLIALLEFLWKSWKNARVDKQSFCSEVSEEIRFAVRCFGGSKKSVKRTPSKDIVDNGIQFAPLTGIPNNRNPKELYA